jgi:hypothetical protein
VTAYSIHSHSYDRHDITWPDGASATVIGPWKLAAEMAAGRSTNEQLRREVSRLRDTVSALEECVLAVSYHRDALHGVAMALDEVRP